MGLDGLDPSTPWPLQDVLGAPDSGELPASGANAGILAAAASHVRTAAARPGGGMLLIHGANASQRVDVMVEAVDAAITSAGPRMPSLITSFAGSRDDVIGALTRLKDRLQEECRQGSPRVLVAIEALDRDGSGRIPDADLVGFGLAMIGNAQRQARQDPTLPSVTFVAESATAITAVIDAVRRVPGFPTSYLGDIEELTGRGNGAVIALDGEPSIAVQRSLERFRAMAQGRDPRGLLLMTGDPHERAMAMATVSAEVRGRATELHVDLGADRAEVEASVRDIVGGLRAAATRGQVAGRREGVVVFLDHLDASPSAIRHPDLTGFVVSLVAKAQEIGRSRSPEEQHLPRILLAASSSSGIDELRQGILRLPRVGDHKNRVAALFSDVNTVIADLDGEGPAGATEVATVRRVPTSSGTRAVPGLRQPSDGGSPPRVRRGGPQNERRTDDLPAFEGEIRPVRRMTATPTRSGLVVPGDPRSPHGIALPSNTSMSAALDAPPMGIGPGPLFDEIVRQYIEPAVASAVDLVGRAVSTPVSRRAVFAGGLFAAGTIAALAARSKLTPAVSRSVAKTKSQSTAMVQKSTTHPSGMPTVTPSANARTLAVSLPDLGPGQWVNFGASRAPLFTDGWQYPGGMENMTVCQDNVFANVPRGPALYDPPDTFVLNWVARWPLAALEDFEVVGDKRVHCWDILNEPRAGAAIVYSPGVSPDGAWHYQHHVAVVAKVIYDQPEGTPGRKIIAYISCGINEGLAAPADGAHHERTLRYNVWPEDPTTVWTDEEIGWMKDLLARRGWSMSDTDLRKLGHFLFPLRP